MYEIKPLEEEWEKYRKRKRHPYVLFSLFVLLAAGGATVFYYSKGINTLFSSKEMNVTTEPRHVSSGLSERKLSDSMEVSGLEDQNASFVKKSISDEIVENFPLESSRPVRKKPRVKMHIVTTEIPTVKTRTEDKERSHKKVHLHIKKVSASNAYHEVAARFKETQDPDDSLFLAKAYYKKGHYKKAEYWALQTNNVDSHNEESVLLFAKAKAKRKRRSEAIRILSKYIHQTHSMEAKILLLKIKQNKI